MRSLSKSVPGLLGKVFERKYIALGRIVTHWKEIVGTEFAERSSPVKIHYIKPKQPKDKPTATLEIGASSADCAVLVYQKDVILQRINHLFGDGWIHDIKFLHVEPKRAIKPPKRTKNLTETEKNHLSQMLESVDDPELKDRLSRLGQSIMQETKK